MTILDKILGFLLTLFVVFKIRVFKMSQDEELSYLNLFKNSDLRDQFNILHRTWEYTPKEIPRVLILNEIRKFPVDIDFSNLLNGLDKHNFTNFLNGDLFYLFDTGMVANKDKQKPVVPVPFNNYGDSVFSKKGIRLLWDYGKEIVLEYPIHFGGWRYEHPRKLYFPSYVRRYKNFVAFYNTDKVLNLPSTYIKDFNKISHPYYLTAVFEFYNEYRAEKFEEIFNFLLDRMLIKFS